MDVIQLIGRLHPLILHLPIGILVLAFLMELVGRRSKYRYLQEAVGFALLVGIWSAILAAISGYLLSWEGGYDEIILNRHQWAGITTAIATVIVYFFQKRKKTNWGQKIYLPFFSFLLVLIGVTGHLGGSLTHGSDFLLEPFSEKETENINHINNIDSAIVFMDLVEPIFKEKCLSCHNESKLKGKLLMTSIAGIQRGGEEGAFMNPGDAMNSLFLQRIKLPLEEKKHMPPKGKQQLSRNEIKLLEWWVSEGASFDKSIASIKKDEEIESILRKHLKIDESVYSLPIDFPNDNSIQKLRATGVSVDFIIDEKPFLSVSLKGQIDLDQKRLKKLYPIAEQLIELDLRETNMNDDLIPVLANFPNLQKVFLQKTNVKGHRLKSLKKLKYLEYLNLYDSDLDDEGIIQIGELKALKRVFLWGTNVTQQKMTELKKERPNLDLNNGVDQTIFGKAQLKEPIISIEKDIFRDSAKIAFLMNHRGVKLFYTLDGNPPDSSSNQYHSPFQIFQTANIQVIAMKEGWGTSNPAEKTIVRAKYRPTKISLNKPPKDPYKAEGASSLINFKKGTTNFSEGEWLGYEGTHFSAILDMGIEKEISNVSVSALESTGSYIFFPKQIEILISKDGLKYQSISQKDIPTTSAPASALTRNFSLPCDITKGQFVKVLIKSNLKNPDWHPAPGAPCWVFVDEILVE